MNYPVDGYQVSGDSKYPVSDNQVFPDIQHNTYRNRISKLYIAAQNLSWINKKLFFVSTFLQGKILTNLDFI